MSSAASSASGERSDRGGGPGVGARTGTPRGRDGRAVSGFDRSRVTVRVPATSANLGPAFDCAGLALACHDSVVFAPAPSGLSVEVTGVGAGELPEDGSHLVVRAFRAACDELGWSPPGLRVSADNAIPQGRGMGSSAAAVVAGVMGAWALCPDVETIDLDAVLRLSTAMEGHPDNVAACLHGGLTLTWARDGGDVGAATVEVDPGVLPVVLVPDATLSTEVARGLLPDVVPHADAAFNAGRAALLVHALTRGTLLLEATADRLHQRQRAAAMPESMALVDRLRDAGQAAVVSGAGPSVLVLARRTVRARDEEPGAAEVRDIAALTPPGWSVLPLDVDDRGCRLDFPLREVSSR